MHQMAEAVDIFIDMAASKPKDKILSHLFSESAAVVAFPMLEEFLESLLELWMKSSSSPSTVRKLEKVQQGKLFAKLLDSDKAEAAELYGQSMAFSGDVKTCLAVKYGPSKQCVEDLPFEEESLFSAKTDEVLSKIAENRKTVKSYWALPSTSTQQKLRTTCQWS
uniref:Uncharacterized protein n=1 Tax=Sphaerodactylus townsendi TaxID=933632 RepID=A0ACB8F3H1_9SAUR